jgi:hypothetical protein
VWLWFNSHIQIKGTFSFMLNVPCLFFLFQLVDVVPNSNVSNSLNALTV